MILLWGLLQDPPMRAVHEQLRRAGANVAFVDYADLPRTRLQFTGGCYRLTCGSSTYALEEMSSVYLRPHDPRDYADGEALPRARVVHSLMNEWAEWSAATVISRPSAEVTNHSKLWQAIQIHDAGFLVPESLVSNDREQIRIFQDRHGELIFKSMSSVRSIVKPFDPASLDAIDALGPVFFQQRIHGQNVRVHVIREQTFASAVKTDGVDYRYTRSQLMPFELPRSIATRCIALTRQLSLVLSGIDLIVTPQDRWYCLEVNPNPGFTHYDLWEDGAIARSAAAALLDSGHESGDTQRVPDSYTRTRVR